jgi:DeoR/GlpR family transcriptional regulator of sugar metabolism
MSALLKQERQRQIVAWLQRQKQVTVADLSRHFGTSEVTIRRDLHELAVAGQLVRAHRGALATEPAPPEPPVLQRVGIEASRKQRIAQAAAQLVGAGEAIFIGSGSTTRLLAAQLHTRANLTVVTNSLDIAMELSATGDQVTVVLTGGVLRKSELSVLGHIAEQSLLELRVDKVFMGMQAISLAAGMTTDHILEVRTTRQIIDMAPELVVVADSSKLGRTAAAFIAPASRIATLVTDASADAATVAELQRQGVYVVIA